MMSHWRLIFLRDNNFSQLKAEKEGELFVRIENKTRNLKLHLISGKIAIQTTDNGIDWLEKQNTSVVKVTEEIMPGW